MKYVKQFDEHDDYTLYVEDDPVLPNVSKCDAERHVHYNPKFVSVPLTFDIKSDGVIKWTAANDASPLTIKYSKNGGEWTNISSSTTGAEIAVNSGDIVQFKGSNSTYCTTSNTYSSFEKNTIVFNVYGNIMSLIDENNYNSLIEFPSDTANNFYKFFYACKNLLSAKNLVLPALTLSTQCYNSLFNECRSLKIGPQLPATTISAACYANMFRNCTSLTQTPTLPATTLNLRCYESMFSGCTSLTQAPELSATTLTPYCYYQMFRGCTSLTTAPELPATTLADDCYSYMFKGCTSLTAAPELPAITLAPQSYYEMFHGCNKLNYIKCLATNISATNCTSNWVNGVAASGTFVKNPNMTSWTTGIHGIPEGWTVIDAE